MANLYDNCLKYNYHKPKMQLSRLFHYFKKYFRRADRRPQVCCYALFLSFLITALAGCGDDNLQSECLSNGLDSACFPRPDTSGKTLIGPHLSTVTFIVETSGSMKGYMPDNLTTTEFQKLLPDMIQRVNDKFRAAFYVLHDSKSPLIRDSLREVTENAIPHGNFNWSGTTYIPVMMDTIKKYLDSNKVNFFVSDCIYSPESTNTKLTAQVIAEIRGQFTPIAGKYATAVYMVKSKFYRKGQPVVISPFYMVLQGKTENLVAVEKLMKQSFGTFQLPYEYVHFGYKYVQPFYSILPYTATTGNFQAGKSRNFQDAFVSLKEVALDGDSKTAEFWLGLNLADLPAYAGTKSYLDSNLVIKMSNGTVHQLKATISANQVRPEDLPIFERCNVWIRLSIDNLPEHVAVISISLRNKRPTWISQISHDDLLRKETYREKTYGLDNIATGLEQAYAVTDSTYFFKNLELSIVKSQ